MCAIAGIISNSSVSAELYDSLIVQQHRGQDASGIMTSEDDAKMHLCKSNGLVQDVFNLENIQGLIGNMGIGHCRYPTAGCASSEEAQPFFVNSPYGISFVHNGNTINTDELRKDLVEKYHRHINTTSDSEVLLNVLANNLTVPDTERITDKDLFNAVENFNEKVQGAYAVIAMIAGFGILAFRDPHGIRPLCYGVRKSESGLEEYMFASESVALDALGFTLLRDVDPGEAIFITKHGEVSSSICAKETSHYPCVIEYVYLARTDSVIDNVSVYESRLNMGDKLAKRIKEVFDVDQIDVVIPVPDSGRTAALQLAATLKKDYQEGFVKNRYIGRTFIMPGQSMRKNAVRKKLNPIAQEFEGKNVLIVDDSIVRGNTSREIIKLAREAGAKKVFFASTAPPVKYPNVYGIDMPTRKELIASNRSFEEIEEKLGVDKVF